VDLLRGVVMIVMALDHVRDFFHGDERVAVQPRDDDARNIPGVGGSPIFCAPVFLLLAGVSGRLWMRKGRTRAGARHEKPDEEAVAKSDLH